MSTSEKKIRSARRIEIAQQRAEEFVEQHRDHEGVADDAGGIILQLVGIIEDLKKTEPIQIQPTPQFPMLDKAKIAAVAEKAGDEWQEQFDRFLRDEGAEPGPLYPYIAQELHSAYLSDELTAICTGDGECQMEGHTQLFRTAEWNPPPQNGQKITTWREHKSEEEI